MYRQNRLKQRLRNGENVLGLWTMLGHPQVVEILSLAGYDFLVLDQEHGLGDPTTLAAQLHAMSATPTTGVVRVPVERSCVSRSACSTSAQRPF